jgi:prepilin-type N-terminal cleavage/methylation domain-containing protein
MMKKANAFTLLELLDVMAIMAILTVIGLSSFGTVREKTRDSKRKEHLTSMSKALEMYYNDFKHYPASQAGYIMGCGVDAQEQCNWGDVFQNASNSTLYMGELPLDPKGDQYFYESLENGQAYRIYAHLENPEDSQAAHTTGNPSLPGVYQGTYCRVSGETLVADSCNYVLMSSNLTNTPTILESAE